MEARDASVRVFLADRSSLLRDRLADIFGEIPAVRVVGQDDNSETVVAKVLAACAEVVVLDISLPPRNGLEVLRELRQKTLAMKIVVLTNESDNAYRQRCQELGADFFFDKTREVPRVSALLRRWGHQRLQAGASLTK